MKQCCPDPITFCIYYKCEDEECQLCISKRGFKQEPLLFDNTNIKQLVRTWAKRGAMGFHVPDNWKIT
jgi:hypothetical protein